MPSNTVATTAASPVFSLHPIRLHGPIGQWAAPMAGTITATSPEAFFGAGTRVDLADLSLMEVRLAPSRYEQKPGMPDQVDVVAVASGHLRYRCPGGRRDALPGDLVFSRPTRDDVLEVRSESTLIRATIPAEAFPRAFLQAEDLPLVAVSDRMAKPFAAVVLGIVDGPERTRASTVFALRDALVGMAAALIDEAGGGRSDRAAGLLAGRARLHIDACFTDPRMTPIAVADALGVSIRTLHLAFEPEELSVARYIRHRRLEAVERTIAAGGTDSVTSLAREFGFSGADQLARAYRAEYGRPVTASRRSSRCA